MRCSVKSVLASSDLIRVYALLASPVPSVVCKRRHSQNRTIRWSTLDLWFQRYARGQTDRQTDFQVQHTASLPYGVRIGLTELLQDTRLSLPTAVGRPHKAPFTFPTTCCMMLGILDHVLATTREGASRYNLRKFSFCSHALLTFG